MIPMFYKANFIVMPSALTKNFYSWGRYTWNKSPINKTYKFDISDCFCKMEEMIYCDDFLSCL